MTAGGGRRWRAAAARGRRLRRRFTCHIREVRVSTGTRRGDGVGGFHMREGAHREGGGVIGTWSLSPPGGTHVSDP